MHAAAHAASVSKALWTGRTLSGLVVAFLLFDSIIKLVKIQPVVDAFAQLGYPASQARGIGVIELACAVLYATPRTSILGGILLTGLLGGAIASHVRIESPLLTHTLFGVYLGLMTWGGLFLRDERLRALIPLR